MKGQFRMALGASQYGKQVRRDHHLPILSASHHTPLETRASGNGWPSGLFCWVSNDRRRLGRSNPRPRPRCLPLPRPHWHSGCPANDYVAESPAVCVPATSGGSAAQGVRPMGQYGRYSSSLTRVVQNLRRWRNLSAWAVTTGTLLCSTSRLAVGDCLAIKSWIRFRTFSSIASISR